VAAAVAVFDGALATAVFASPPSTLLYFTISILPFFFVKEVPVADLVRPIVKKVYQITDVNEVAATVLEALYVCTSGRPGPVLIDFPKNIQQQRVRLNQRGVVSASLFVFL